MSPADLKDKKRKRSSRSPVPATRSSFKMATKEVANVEAALAKHAFNRVLDSLEKETQDYKDNRTRLLQAEDENSWDHHARKSASETERMAGAILRGIREFERKVTFGNWPSEAIPDPETRDMGGQFLTNKDRIEQQSKIFEIAKLVPKGAILHLHFNAELHPKRLLEEARKMENMCIRSIRPILNQEDLDLTEMVFSVKPKDTENANIFSSEYQGKDDNWRKPKIEPKIWMKWSDFRSEFNKAHKGAYRAKYATTDANMLDNGALPNSSEQGTVNLEPAENWLLRKMVLGEEEAYNPTQTVNG